MLTPVLAVKNMVCHRCILTVENILQQLSIKFTRVTAGEIYLHECITASQLNALGTALGATGLELITNRMEGTIEKIKQLVIKKARNEVDEAAAQMKLSAFLSAHLHHEYTYLSSFFSEAEGRTIENLFIEQRVEKVKELLVYNENTLAAIAFDMGYSSVAHLSARFKQVTGLTPSHFRQAGTQKRKLIDKI